MAAPRMPQVRDEFTVRAQQLGKSWHIVKTYDNDVNAFWQVPGLQFMPWEKMPRAEGRAVCFATGGHRVEQGGNYVSTAEAILFFNSKWHHIKMIVNEGRKKRRK